MSSLEFNKILRQLVREDGSGISNIARSTGISKSTLGNWLHGTNPTDLQALRKLARYFDVPFEYLIFGDTTPDKQHRTTSVILDGVYRVRMERLESER